MIHYFFVVVNYTQDLPKCVSWVRWGTGVYGLVYSLGRRSLNVTICALPHVSIQSIKCSYTSSSVQDQQIWEMSFEVIDISQHCSHVKHRYKFVRPWRRMELWCIFTDLFFSNELQRRIQQWWLSLTSHIRLTSFSLISHHGNNISPLSDIWSHNFSKSKSLTYCIKICSGQWIYT